MTIIMMRVFLRNHKYDTINLPISISSNPVCGSPYVSKVF